MCSVSRFQIALYQTSIGKMLMTSKFADPTSLSIVLTLPYFFFKFSYWSKNYDDFFLQGICPKIQKSEITRLSLVQISRLGKVRDTKFNMNVSNDYLPNAAKCKGTIFAKKC